MSTSTAWFATENINIITELIKFVVSVLAPLLAGYFGVRYGLKQIKMQKRMDLIENQLNKFYSPLLGLHKEIRAKSELRVKIQKLGDEAWQESSKDARASRSSPDMTPYSKEIEYNNKQLKEIFIPQYNEMLEIFRENFWLAEPETREFYPKLVEFVEIWNRNSNDGLPPDVALKINHTEEELKPFYDELVLRTDMLRQELLKI
jgi:predicted Rdx family selenoprotein